MVSSTFGFGDYILRLYEGLGFSENIKHYSVLAVVARFMTVMTGGLGGGVGPGLRGSVVRS